MRRRGSLWRSFACARAGILHGVRTQRNVRIHAAATGVVMLLAATFRITAAEWTAVLLAIGLVWAAELLNTAIEAVVDLISPEDHDLARIAKDTSSGAVLAAAAAALLVGIVVFAPRLWSLWR
jgi:diacylglycerol kinase